jgi:hypothetical protein
VIEERVHMCVMTGTRYMVVDCGGGTVDITVHEMVSEAGNLLELHRASGGPYGSLGQCHLAPVCRYL